MTAKSTFPCPAISRAGSSRALQQSPFNEGVSVPRADFDRLAAQNPALVSRDTAERSEATRKAILTGELAPYRRR